MQNCYLPPLHPLIIEQVDNKLTIKNYPAKKKKVHEKPAVLSPQIKTCKRNRVINLTSITTEN